MYDIGIVGAGPAGTTLARLLAEQYKILLLDSGRTKCCGGLVHPRAKKILARLGLTLPQDILVAPQPSVVVVMDWNNSLVRKYRREYTNVDRAAFDHWLLSLIPPTVDIRNNALYKKCEQTDGKMTLHFTENGEAKRAQVRWLVGADGAFSAVRREFFPHVPLPKRYIAVQHWFEQEEVSATPQFDVDIWNNYTGIFDSKLTDFYGWTIPKYSQLLLGGAFPWVTNAWGTNISATMTIIKKKLESQGLRLGTPFKREAGQILRPLHHSTYCFGDSRTILVGEAAGLIGPNSAEGISSALHSALSLAESFRPSGYDASLYRRLLNSQLWGLWLKKFRIPPMYYPRVRNLVMRLGITTIR